MVLRIWVYVLGFSVFDLSLGFRVYKLGLRIFGSVFRALCFVIRV